MIYRSPILIFGLPRSGTSWIARIFDSHPDTLYRHEPDRRFLDSGLAIAPDAEAIQGGSIRARAYLEACLASSREKHVGSPPYSKKSYRSPAGAFGRTALVYGLKGIGRWAPDLAALFTVPDMIRPRDRERVRIVWKSVAATTQLGAYARILPNARCLFVIRNPGGQITSRQEGIGKGYLAGQPLGQGSREPLDAWMLEPILRGAFGHRYGLNYEDVRQAQGWERVALGWAIENQAAADSIEGLTNARLVRYEDVANDPVTCSRELFKFARLEWNAQTEAFIKFSSQPRRGGESYFGLYRDSQSQIDKWRKTLDGKTIEKIGAIVCRFPVGRLYADSFMTDAKL